MTAIAKVIERVAGEIAMAVAQSGGVPGANLLAMRAIAAHKAALSEAGYVIVPRDALATAIPDRLPAHKCELIITHNAHTTNYQTVAEYLADHPPTISEDERERAIAANEIWELQWYPNTPNGFCRIAASSFPALLAAAPK